MWLNCSWTAYKQIWMASVSRAALYVLANSGRVLLCSIYNSRLLSGAFPAYFRGSFSLLWDLLVVSWCMEWIGLATTAKWDSACHPGLLVFRQHIPHFGEHGLYRGGDIGRAKPPQYESPPLIENEQVQLFNRWGVCTYVIVSFESVHGGTQVGAFEVNLCSNDLRAYITSKTFTICQWMSPPTPTPPHTHF